jgi:hypothetical protein
LAVAASRASPVPLIDLRQAVEDFDEKRHPYNPSITAAALLCHSFRVGGVDTRNRDGRSLGTNPVVPIGNQPPEEVSAARWTRRCPFAWNERVGRAWRQSGRTGMCSRPSQDALPLKIGWGCFGECQLDREVQYELQLGAFVCGLFALASDHPDCGSGASRFRSRKCILRRLAQRSSGQSRRGIQQSRMDSWLRDCILSIRIQAGRRCLWRNGN